MSRYYSGMLALMVCAGLFLSGCSGASKVNSAFTDSEIKVDGNQGDWQGSLQTVEGDNVAYGFKNDGKNLYFCLVTADASKMMKMLANGMTVWFTPGNSGDKIGVKFPQKMTIEDMRNMRAQNQDGQGPRDQEQRIQSMISMQKELAVVNKDERPLYSSEINLSKDFQAALNYSMGQFVYELRVPLAAGSSSQTALKAGPGDDVKVNIETGKFERPAGGSYANRNSGDASEGQGNEGSRPRRGGGQRQGGRGNRGGGEGGGRMMGDTTPLNYSFDVQLGK
ncbi:MAG: hypothetical protein ACM3UR_13130 [Bacteroidota bacterium]